MDTQRVRESRPKADISRVQIETHVNFFSIFHLPLFIFHFLIIFAEWNYAAKSFYFFLELDNAIFQNQFVIIEFQYWNISKLKYLYMPIFVLYPQKKNNLKSTTWKNGGRRGKNLLAFFIGLSHWVFGTWGHKSVRFFKCQV